MSASAQIQAQIDATLVPLLERIAYLEGAVAGLQDEARSKAQASRPAGRAAKAQAGSAAVRGEARDVSK